MCIYIQILRPTTATALRWRTDAAHAQTAGRASMTDDRRPHDGRPQTAGRKSMTDDRRPHGRFAILAQRSWSCAPTPD